MAANIKNDDLRKLTGLTDKELAEVLSKNPRAYMAVKGAVAEKHLEKLLIKMRSTGEIQDYRKCSNDFEKDFYVILKGKKEISLECKNVQVLNIGNKDLKIKYINFLISSNYLENKFVNDYLKACKVIFDPKDTLTNILNSKPASITADLFKSLTQDLKESGLPRYEFSASFIKNNNAYNRSTDEFLEQFTTYPLTIDFQRTRNSTDKDGDTRRQRLYKLNEIDVVGACLFSRTLEWQFVFGKSKHFTKHVEFNDRYSNRLEIYPSKWSTSLTECLKIN